MRTTFSGLGLAIGLAVMVVFMIMASQFKSLRLPFIMLFTIPVSLLGIVLALIAGGQGFSITALMGVLMVVGIAVSNGILLVDDANRRFDEGADKVEAVVAAARSRFVPIVMTSLATVIGLIPDGARARSRHRGQSAARARRRRRPDVVDAAVAVPRARDVPADRAPAGRSRGARAGSAAQSLSESIGGSPIDPGVPPLPSSQLRRISRAKRRSDVSAQA